MPGKERNPSWCVPSFRSQGSPGMTPSCQRTKERVGHGILCIRICGELKGRDPAGGKGARMSGCEFSTKSLYLDQRVVLRKLAATGLFDFDISR